MSFVVKHSRTGWRYWIKKKGGTYTGNKLGTNELTGYNLAY